MTNVRWPSAITMLISRLKKKKIKSFVSTTEIKLLEQKNIFTWDCAASFLGCTAWGTELKLGAWGFEVKAQQPLCFLCFPCHKEHISAVTELSEWALYTAAQCNTCWPLSVTPLQAATYGTGRDTETPCWASCLIIVRNMHVVGCIFLLEASFSMCFSQHKTCKQ